MTEQLDATTLRVIVDVRNTTNLRQQGAVFWSLSAVGQPADWSSRMYESGIRTVDLPAAAVGHAVWSEEITVPQGNYDLSVWAHRRNRWNELVHSDGVRGTGEPLVVSVAPPLVRLRQRPSTSIRSAAILAAPGDELANPIDVELTAEIANDTSGERRVAVRWDLAPLGGDDDGPWWRREATVELAAHELVVAPFSTATVDVPALRAVDPGWYLVRAYLHAIDVQGEGSTYDQVVMLEPVYVAAFDPSVLSK